MTAERLAEAIAEINNFNSIGTSTFEKCLERDTSLRVLGITIEIDPKLTEEERDEARAYYFKVRPPEPLILGID